MGEQRKYLRYLDSKNEWIGLIPSDWTTTKIKWHFNIKNGGTPKSGKEEYWDDSDGIIWITPEDLKDRGNTISDSRRKLSVPGLNNSSANLINRNSIVLSTRAPIGKVKICTVDYTTNQGCKNLEPIKPLDIRFFYYVILSSEKYIQSLGQGTTFTELSNYSLRNLVVPFPNMEVQKQIADFLDQKTFEIDDFIADKEHLIELLEEKRQAVITEAVTKGLDSGVKMKDSEIDWIDAIPKHWESKPLYSVIKESKMKNKGNMIKNVLSLSYGRIIRRDVETNFGLLPESFETYQIVNPGTIVLRLTDLQNDKRSLRSGLVMEKGIITSAYTALIPNERLDSAFAYYLFHTYDLFKVFYGLGSGVRQSMNFNDLKKVPILLPPLDEQIAIVNYLKEKTSDIGFIIKRTKIQIEKLKEYRQSLIYEAVTGKIDVRDYPLERKEEASVY